MRSRIRSERPSGDSKYEHLYQPNWYWDAGWRLKEIKKLLKKNWKARRKQKNLHQRRQALERRREKLEF